MDKVCEPLSDASRLWLELATAREAREKIANQICAAIDAKEVIEAVFANYRDNGGELVSLLGKYVEASEDYVQRRARRSEVYRARN
jgi:hypothetical protein